MNTFLWVLQWILALAFLAAGAMKAFMPEDKLRANPQMGWVETAGMQQARTAGIAEVLAALGLVLPGLLGILPILTPLAATGLVVVMALALRLHITRDDPTQAKVGPAVLGLLALIVAIGRFFIEPLPT